MATVRRVSRKEVAPAQSVATFPSSNVTECIGDVVDYAASGLSSVAHCISADAAMGAGIAKALDANFGLRERVRALPRELVAVGNVVELRCRACDGSVVSVFNMITKEAYWELPTYDTMRAALRSLRAACDEYEADAGTVSSGERRMPVLTMPRIGCGIDRLAWDRVLPMVVEAFSGSGTDVRVCRIA